MTEKTLKNPPQLDRIYELRKKLHGTDRDDHVAELDMWEKKTKKALIFLNLKEHEGIPDLLAMADKEIRLINEKLLSEEFGTNIGPEDFRPDTLVHQSLARQRLIDLRSMWMWFKSLFSEAKESLNEVEAFLNMQEEPGTEDDPYVGG